MLDSIAYIAKALKDARKQKGLSQRALSLKTKIPQSHISKIENGAIDLQTSSLIEISRSLDLEVMLVPRGLVPAFKALLRRTNKDISKQIPLYRLEKNEEEEGRDDV